LVVVVGLGLISLLQIPTNRRAPDGEPISVDLLQLELSLPTCADPQSRTTEHFSTRKLRQGLAEAEHYTVQDGEQIILQSESESTPEITMVSISGYPGLTTLL
jgi:hypothetical protein